jgi:hypothetical protein
MWSDSHTERVYVRELPGGGFVAIDVQVVRAVGSAMYFGSLIAERRSSSRGAGQSPPMLAEATGPSVDAVLKRLLPIAQSNPAIGAALLRPDHRSVATDLPA